MQPNTLQINSGGEHEAIPDEDNYYYSKMPFTYKAVTYQSSQLPLKISEVTIPAEQKDGVFSVSENDILIKVKVAALNPVDSILKNSLHPWIARGENIFGKDFAGDVVAIGTVAAGRTPLKIGDRVAGVVQGMSFKNGSLAEYVLVNAFDESGKATTKIPDGLSYEQAAALPVVLGTAYQAVETAVANKSQLKKVLVLGGATSVGRFAVQLLKNVHGAEEIVASCSGRSAEAIKGYGATSIIDYTQHKLLLEPVLESVKESGPFDFILDCCGNNDLFGHLDTILRPKAEGGSYATVAGDDKYTYASASMLLMMKNSFWMILRALKGRLNLLSYLYQFIMLDLSRERFSAALNLVEDGALKVDIDSEYEFADFQKAVDRQLTNKAAGKVLIKIA